ncbi:MAG TPA: response regulator [Candidatus Polarisedimenticolia bacterium]|nr:response regulator [Candidatus Polarisedimenticolia bacterium]
MSDLSREIIRHIPFLRRYARALTGTQEQGDHYVKASLGSLLADPARLETDIPLRLQLFKLFHDTFGANADTLRDGRDADPSLTPLPMQKHLKQLPSRERQVLLLSTIEGFSAHDVGFILGISEPEASRLLERAKTELMQQSRTAVLVIEDEPVIAFDIAGIVTEMGHRVIGTAATKSEAVAAARVKRPGLILADIQLDDGSTGIDAVREILDVFDVPVIFVTAFPERLLTGEKTEPAFLVAKPFEPDVLKITIAQALYTRRANEDGNDRNASAGLA